MRYKNNSKLLLHSKVASLSFQPFPFAANISNIPAR